MELGKYSLRLRETLCKNNLYKSSFTHGCYFNVFSSCRKQTDCNDGELSQPLLSDFTSINFDDNIMLTQAFSISKPFSIASMEDRCLKLVQDKRAYRKYFEHCQRKYKRHAKQVNHNVKKNRKGGNFLPSYIINLYNTNDPDPFFDTFYDWYYTGGVLDTISVDNREYFVGVLEDNLCLRYLKNAKIKQNYHFNDGPIFNLRSYSDGNINYVTIRGKNDLKLLHFKFDESEDLVLHEDWHAFDSTPYIDCKLYSSDTIGTINMQNLFKSIDLGTLKLLFDYKISESIEKPNCFCLFDSIDKQNLLFMDRKQINLFDLRSSEACNVLMLEEFPMSRCEELCYFITSKHNSNYIFACTSHSIAKVDLRNKNIVKQWSHLLTSPPIMMDSLLQNGHEFVCVSSFTDRILLTSTPEENNLPKLIPTPTDSFNHINLEQNIILEGLTKRLQSSVNGIKMSSINTNNISIHYCTALGDLFCNDIQLKSVSQNVVNNEIAFAKMKKWLKSLQKKETKEPKTLYATDVAREWSSIKQLHCKGILEHNLDKYRDEIPVKLDLDIDPYEFDMSAIWGARADEIQLPEESSAVKKVTEWLHRDMS